MPSASDAAATSSAALVHVATDHPYTITIGHDLGDEVVAATGEAQRAAILHPPPLAARASALADMLADAGMSVHPVEVPDGEAAKTVKVLDRCWECFSEIGLDRTSVVLGLGGGSTTDLAGFAAATYMRGIRLIQLPTTVLGMVDAAIGGKTGINTPAGKNMAGSFYEPDAVIADLDALATLPADDIVAGLGEVIKCGFIADPEILRIVEDDPQRVTQPGSAELAEVIRRGAAVKAGVVAEDLTESNVREILNYGHTLGHAIEKREQYRWQHGRAVAVGMVFVAELARAAGTLHGDVADRHRAVLDLVGLPTRYDDGALPELIEWMGHDKKARDGRLRFVTLDALALPARLNDPDPALLELAYDAMQNA